MHARPALGQSTTRNGGPSLDLPNLFGARFAKVRSGLPMPRLSSLSQARTPRVRSLRVSLLLAATCLMCLADLWMTLLYATSIGMIESNPIARAVMEHDSPYMLAGWKLATVVLSNGILFWNRRVWYAELATWLCFLTMAALSVHWLNYSNQVSSYTTELSMLAMTEDPRWVTMQAE